MDQDNAKGDTDHGKLFIGIRRTVIDQQLVGQAISGNGILEDFLEVVGIVVIKETAADQKSGMVIDDHDAVNAP